MSYEKRVKKRSIRKKLRISLISFILLYLIFRSAPIILSMNLKTTLSQVDTFKTEIPCDGVVIKSEEVFRFDGQGIVEKKIAEGQRVPVGVDIANLNFLKDTSGLKYEIKEIENTISLLTKEDNQDQDLEEAKEEVEKNKEDMVNNIQSSIKDGKFKDITFSNKDSYSYDNKELGTFKNKGLLELSLDELEERKKSLKKQIDENNKSYKTDLSGIISYEIDGYENLFKVEDIEELTYENLDFSKPVKSEENLNGFKIIDNFTWYLALKIDNIKDITSFEENDTMNVSFDDHDKNISGKIIKINKSGDKAVVVLIFRDYFQDYYKLRFSKVNILMSSKKAYKIPKKTIIEKDEQKGVYIKDFNGIVKFRPVIIMGEEKEYVFVDMGKSGYIEIPPKKDSIKTIGRYDEIFLKPNRIEEGQILN